MGRHSKALAEVLASLDQAIVRQRQFEGLAATASEDDKRVLFRVFAKDRQEAIDAGRHWIPSRPSYLRNFTCGARTSSGKSCRMTALFSNGRCIWHGGKSTGPRTPEGKARALANLNLGRRKRREVMGAIK